MSGDPAHAGGRREFLVTLDIGEKVASFQNVGIKTPPADDPFFRRIQCDAVDALQEALGNDIPVRTVSMSDLAGEVLSHAYRARKTEGGLIVSTCREFAEPMKGVTLDINRMVDQSGKSLGIGPRPGADSIDEQLRVIKLHAQDRPVVIVEDGIFSGGTVQFIVDRCRQAGIEVSQVVVGFRFPGSQERIDTLMGMGVEVTWLEEFGDLVDWVPDHDFLPMVPNCGRILGVLPFGDPVPYYSPTRAAYSIPYLHPFSPVEDWASIPTATKRDLAKVCLSLSQQIYTKLDLMNDHKVRIEEVLAAPQPVTIPFRLDHGTPGFTRREAVGEFLNELSHAVAFDLYQAT